MCRHRTTTPKHRMLNCNVSKQANGHKVVNARTKFACEKMPFFKGFMNWIIKEDLILSLPTLTRYTVSVENSRKKFDCGSKSHQIWLREKIKNKNNALAYLFEYSHSYPLMRWPSKHSSLAKYHP